jgi:ribonuclease HI
VKAHLYSDEIESARTLIEHNGQHEGILYGFKWLDKMIAAGVVLNNKTTRKELSDGYRLTTNNRMELMACIVALRSLKKRSSAIL